MGTKKNYACNILIFNLLLLCRPTTMCGVRKTWLAGWIPAHNEATSRVEGLKKRAGQVRLARSLLLLYFENELTHVSTWSLEEMCTPGKGTANVVTAFSVKRKTRPSSQLILLDADLCCCWHLVQDFYGSKLWINVCCLSLRSWSSQFIGPEWLESNTFFSGISVTRPCFYWRRWPSLTAELLAQGLYIRDAAWPDRSLVSALEGSHLFLALPSAHTGQMSRGGQHLTSGIALWAHTWI